MNLFFKVIIVLGVFAGVLIFVPSKKQKRCEKSLKTESAVYYTLDDIDTVYVESFSFN